MAAKIGGDDDTPIADINIVPFVDIILVVLIIFMVTTPFIMKPSILVNLPETISGDDSTPSELAITVTADGQVLLNGEPADEPTISAYAAQMVEQKPDIQAVISADRDITHGKVVGVIDAVKSAGVKRFAITVDRQ